MLDRGGSWETMCCDDEDKNRYPKGGTQRSNPADWISGISIFEFVVYALPENMI